MAFDIEGARRAGYSDAEIADHLAGQRNFDVAGARKAGYGDAEIINHLSGGAAPEPQQSAALGSTTENVLSGIGRGMTRAGLGLGQVAAKVGQMLGVPGSEDALNGINASVEDMNSTDPELMGTRAGKIGNAIGATAVTAPAFLVPGAQGVVGAGIAGGTSAALTTPGSLEERGKEGIFGALGGAAGTLAGKGLQVGARAVMDKIAANTAAKTAANAGRDTAAAAARDAGYVLPPAQANPTALNRWLEGLSGKIQMGQHASARNQEVTNQLTKQALGLAEDVRLTPEALKDIRANAGQAYQALDNIPITADTQYASDLMKLTSRQTKAAKDFPGSNGSDALSTEISSLIQPQFSGGGATAKISLLREQAKSAFSRGDASLARGLNGAADALENVIDRNLQQTGSPELLQAYREARKQIAMAYSVERALNETTGNVSAQELAKQLAKGKPLSGELKTVAQTARAFPKATQALKDEALPVSPLDLAVGVLGASGGPHTAAAVLARPATRNVLLSQLYQSHMLTPNYGPNALTQLVGNPLQNRLAPQAVGSLGLAGATYLTGQ